MLIYKWQICPFQIETLMTPPFKAIARQDVKVLSSHFIFHIRWIIRHDGPFLMATERCDWWDIYLRSHGPAKVDMDG